jgi:hypothetical protein
MQENELGDEGFTALGNALAVNTTLQQVALGGNRNHTDVGLIYLAHGLRRATKRAAPLNLTGVDLGKVADVIGALLCRACPGLRPLVRQPRRGQPALCYPKP